MFTYDLGRQRKNVFMICATPIT